MKLEVIFLHCLDDEALKVYNRFKMAGDANMKTIITQFDKFKIGELSVTYELFIFNKRNQEDGESFELFQGIMQRLTKSCQYCDNCRENLN